MTLTLLGATIACLSPLAPTRLDRLALLSLGLVLTAAGVAGLMGCPLPVYEPVGVVL